MPHLQLTLSDLLSRLEAFWMESKEGCSAHLLASVTCAAKQKIAGHKYQKTAAGDFTPLTDSPSHPLNYFSLSARRKKPSNISLSSNHPCPLCPPEFLFSADLLMTKMLLLLRENLPHVISSLPRPPFPPAGD